MEWWQFVVGFFICQHLFIADSFRILNLATQQPNGTYPAPFDAGFVGYYGDPTNFGRERINEGAFYTADQELLYEGVSARQSCPNMVGPFSDGNYYCSAREFGYCDRRSGTCFCNIGYQGIDCTECTITHFKIGPHCYPKKLCKNDCSGAGTCNYNNGTCSCLPHRQGEYCQTLLCSIHDTLCISCTAEQCLQCEGGYYLTGNSSKVCSSCYDFDPRCAGCIKEQGCTTCADSVLTSVRRSGYRKSDPQLPAEEVIREFSITLPFGTKSPESFAEAENYVVVTTADNPLKGNSMTCSQGLRNDSSWDCSSYTVSHIVCGHYGVFSFRYPNYAIAETAKFIRMSVQRTGGGYGNVSISYYIQHYTTNDSDVVPTAHYTTNQVLEFTDGVVERSFLITILDDNIPEEDEVFQVVLETPNGGGSVGAQFRTNVTILDDDRDKIAPTLTVPNVTALTTRAMQGYSLMIHGYSATGDKMTTGGDYFVSILENDLNSWTGLDPSFGYQRNTDRIFCNQTDLGNGSYIVKCPGIEQQGTYQLRLYHAFPQTIKGQYYYDSFFERLALTRLDANVNFTWGTGRLMPRGSDYISIRWSGALLTPRSVSGLYYFQVKADDHARLWVNGQLLLDHFHERLADLEPSFPIYLQGGRLYEIVLEYRELNNDAYAVLLWKLPNHATYNVIPYDNYYSLFEIQSSPVLIHVNSSETYAAMTECTGDGLYEAVARRTSYFTVCPRDIYGNLRDDGDEFYLKTQLFSAFLALINDDGYHGIGAETITPILTYNEDTHCFDGEYTPIRAGTYDLYIQYKATPDSTAYDVVGSPFEVQVTPDQSSGPLSDVVGLPTPLYLDAGSCANFTIVMRDNSRNLRLQGGDNIEVYAYRVDYYRLQEGKQPSPTRSPTFQPSLAPTSSITNEIQSDFGEMEIVRYGMVSDQGNGNYSVRICPIIAGIYEIHLLLKGRGISNQPFRILDKSVSILQAMGQGSFLGQYISQSPYKLQVRHTSASLITSTVEGDGLLSATVSVTSTFMLTVRDHYDNVLRDNYLSPNVSLRLDKTPQAKTMVWNYQNGSYLLQYIPILSGTNILSILINGKQIFGSPYLITTAVGITNASFSYAIGDGLITGITGKISYFTVYAFDLQGNRKTNYDDVFYFVISGSNNITGFTRPCPNPRDPDHPVCDPNDTLAGYYYGQFTPLYTGPIQIDVYLVPGETYSSLVASGLAGGRRLTALPFSLSSLRKLSNSPFHAIIYPSELKAENTDVSGTLYDNKAGKTASIYLQARDYFNNKLITGGGKLECAFFGVAGDWGTVQPFANYKNRTTLGLPNQYHYEGFHSHYPNFYSNQIIDYLNGSYQIDYKINITGEYVIRLAFAEDGLNATYFNDTEFGYLYNRFNDRNLNEESYIDEILLDQPVNDGSSISWTGDVGGLMSKKGDLGRYSTYYDRYFSRKESMILVNATRGIANYFPYAQSNRFNITNLTTSGLRYRFREHYWSARWKGMITPPSPELYKFTIIKDSDSSVNLWIGGIGVETNQSYRGELVINSSAPLSSDSTLTGLYLFTDTLYREFLLEYQHFTRDAFLEIYWESVSTKKALIPPSAFSHWRNISHYNLTIHPTTLCPSCSTAWGKSLTYAKVHEAQSFLVYARDIFNNLVQHGSDRPSMVAVGPNGVAFRGKVTDYGNSTYLIQYYPTQSGVFRMYVSVGCCAPNPAIGINQEIRALQPLLIAGSPFLLTIDPAPLDPTRTIAIGNGLIGANAAQTTSFTILYRDVFNNPTNYFIHKGPNSTLTYASKGQMIKIPLLQIIFTNALTNNLINPEIFSLQQASDWNISYIYQINRAGSYFIDTKISLDNGTTYTPLISSPYHIIINPVIPDASKAVCRGVGIRQAFTNQLVNFEIQLYDTFINKILLGGNRFFIRVYGDANFTNSKVSVGSSTGTALTVVPTYTDTQNGRYIVSYKTAFARQHKLVVRLLQGYNQSLLLPPTHPGGEGLIGYYYNSMDGATNAWQGLNLPSLKQLDGPVYERLESKISFTWMNGYLLPIDDIVDNTQQDETISSTPLLLRKLGQSIRWQGYLVAPRTDSFYQIYANAVNMNVTIFLDHELIYDSSEQITRTLPLTQFSAYEIVIIGKVSTKITETDVISIDLRWVSLSSIRDQSISTFYLYPKAEEIQYSPFPIAVDA